MTNNNFPLIAALVPADEHFDATAVNEGVWISQAHLAALEAALAENQNIILVHTENIANLELQITEHQATISAQSATVEARDEEISNLKNEIAELKTQPADELEETRRDADDHGGGGSKWPVLSADRELAKIRAMLK